MSYESSSRSGSLMEHDPSGQAEGMLFGKPVSTFPDHALSAAAEGSAG
jgi:hypothetical protein